jgi:DNA (cytosine-5-)-methyltransferase
MNSYELLEEVVSIEEITEIYYNNKYKLDLETTFELMKKTGIYDVSEGIVFYGKDFKVIQIDSSEEKIFSKISLKKPNKRKVFVPFTLDEYEMSYSQEYKEHIPFKTEEMLREEEEEKRRQEESRKEYKRKQDEATKKVIEENKEELSKNEEITEDFIFNIFEGGIYGNNAYLTIPYFPEKSNSYYISSENFVDKKLRNVVDYLGYAALENGKLTVVAKKTLYLFENEEETELEKEYKEVMKDLLAKRKVIPVIGIGYNRIPQDDERTAKKILIDYLADIKEYYNKQSTLLKCTLFINKKGNKKMKNKELINRVIEGDTLEEMKKIEDKSIDLILVDLPYGTTKNKWDVIIPFENLWKEYNRIIKDNGAMLFTATGIFSSLLMLSNVKDYKYKLIWIKSKSTNFLNVKKQPLRKFEEILVFYKKQPTYNPQKTIDVPYNKGPRKSQLTGSYANFSSVINKSEGERNPTDVLYFKTAETEG